MFRIASERYKETERESDIVKRERDRERDRDRNRPRGTQTKCPNLHNRNII